jgi:hypothetical protein
MKNMKRNNIAELMKDILKFRDTPLGEWMICAGDWTEKCLLAE